MASGGRSSTAKSYKKQGKDNGCKRKILPLTGKRKRTTKDKTASSKPAAG